MADEIQKSFVKSFIEFLKKQIQVQSLPSDGLESLEVAIQCLEAAFELFNDDNNEGIISSAASNISTSSTSGNNVNIDNGAGGDTTNVKLSKTELSGGSGGHILSKLQTIDLFDLYQTTYVESNPNRKELGESIKNEGNRLMKEGKFQEALLQYNRSITYDPTNPVFYCNRAAAYIRVGQHEKAVADCKMALAYNPEYGKAHGRMGIAYSNLNKFNEARTAYQRALELEPDNLDYRNNLRVAEERVTTGIIHNNTSGTNIQLPGNLSNFREAFAAAQSGSGSGGPAGANIANLLFENVPGNMRDFLGDMMRDPVITTALQSLASNPEGLLDMSRQVAAAIATDNPDFIRNVQDTLNTTASNFQQQQDGQGGNSGGGQNPSSSDGGGGGSTGNPDTTQ